MTIEPRWHEVAVDEEVYHFLNKTSDKLNVTFNEVLRSMIFGENVGMSAELREQLARADEAHAQVDIQKPGAMAAIGREHRKRRGGRKMAWDVICYNSDCKR